MGKGTYLLVKEDNCSKKRVGELEAQAKTEGRTFIQYGRNIILGPKPGDTDEYAELTGWRKWRLINV